MLSRGLGRINAFKVGLSGMLAALTLAIAPLSYADVTGEQVVYGDVTFVRQGNKLFIYASDGSIINYSSFNIGQDELVRFFQPGSDARVLNRILGAAPTEIQGTLLANGIVYIVNPAGVIFSKDAVINVGGLYAAAANISNTRFLNGIDRFSNATGTVINEGSLRGDAIHLIGRHVENHGDILAPGGTITMLAGNDILIKEVGGHLILKIDGRVVNGDGRPVAGQSNPNVYDTPGVLNTGTVRAPGGQAYLAAGDMYSLAIHNQGVISARGGEVRVEASDGAIYNEGVIDANTTHGEAGRVIVRGPSVVNAGRISADSRYGDGGYVEVTSSNHTFLTGGSRISASSVYGNANGGEILIHSYNGLTVFDIGSVVDVSGGILGGNGGFVEVSGERLSFAGKVRLIGAPGALAGTLLIDPRDITIADTGPNDGFLADGIIDFNEPNTNVDITISDEALEAIVGNIILEAVRDIFVNFQVDLTNNNNLTMRAGRHIEFNQPITGINDLTLVADAAFTGFPSDGVGDIRMNTSLNIAGVGTMSGVNIELAGDLSSQGWTFNGPIDLNGVGNQSISAGAGTLTANNTILKSSTGNLSLTAGTLLDLNASVTANDGSLLFDGALDLDGDAIASDDVTFNNSAVVSGNVTGTAGAVVFNDTSDVGGNVTAGTDATFTGAAIVGGNVTAGNNVAFDDTADVTGDVEATAGDATFTGAATVGGNVTAGNNVAFNDTSDVTGDVTAGNDATFTGAATVGGSVLAGNDVTFTDTSNIGGDVEATAGEANFGGNAIVDGNVTAGTNVVFNGTASLGGDVTAGADISFFDTANFAGASQIVNAGGTLLADSTITANGDLTLIATVLIDLNDDVNVNGSLTLDGASNVFGDLSAGGDLSLLSAVNFDGVLAQTLTAGGTLQADSTLTKATGDLTLSGANLDLNGNVNVTTGSLTLDGLLALAANLTAGGDISILNDATLDAAGAQTINAGGNLIANGAITKATGNLTLTGTNVDLNDDVETTAGSLTINGVTTASGDLTAGTNLTLNGVTTLDAAGAQTLTAGNTLQLNATVTKALGNLFLSGGTAVDINADVNVTAGNFSSTGGSFNNTGGIITAGNNITINHADGVIIGSNLISNGTLSVQSGNDGTGNLSFGLGGPLLVGNTIILRAGNGAGGGAAAQVIFFNNPTFQGVGGGSPINFIWRQDAAINNATGPLAASFAGGLAGVNYTMQSDDASVTINNAANVAGTNLTINAATNAVLNTALNLESINVTAANIALNGGAITTTNGQTYNGLAALGGASTFTSTNNGAIIFTNDLSGAFALIVNTGGITRFDGLVNVASITTDAGGTTEINGGSVTTTGDQTYGDDVTVGADTVLASNGGNVLFSGALGGPFDLTLNTGAGNATFNGTVSGLIDLIVNSAGITRFNNTVTVGSLTTDAAGSTEINTGAITTTGNQTYNDAVALLANAILTSSGNGNLVFGNTLNGGFTLNLNTGGTTQFDGLVNVGSIITDAGGTTVINGGSVTTSSLQNYNDGVVLGANTIFDAGGNILFLNTVNGNFLLDARTGALTRFGGAVNVGSIITDAGGLTEIDTNSITTSGAQSYNDNVFLLADTTLASSGGGDIDFNGTLSGNQSLNVNTAGTTRFNGAANIGSLETDAPGTTEINGGSVITTGDQRYRDAVTLGANSVLTSSGGGAIRFDGTLGGLFDLTVNTAGQTRFDGAVNLLSLTTDAPGSTFINGATITTTNNQVYGDSVILGGNTTLISTANGLIRLGSNVNGLANLTVNTGGTTQFDGTLNIGNLVTDAGGTTLINANILAANATFNDAVLIGNDLAISAGQIIFLSTLDSEAGETNNLTLTGSTLFGNTVGLNDRLASLTVNGALVINGGLVQTTGNQTYNGIVALGANTVVDSNANGAIRFNGALTGPFSLTANTDGQTRFDDIVDIASLTTDAGGTTLINGGLIRTSGLQSFGDAVTLGANTVFDSTGNSNIIFLSTVDGNFLLDARTGGITRFNGAVNVGSLITDAGGTTEINGGAITTSAGQTYGDAVTLGANAVLTGGGDLLFLNTLNGPFAITLNTSGTTRFDGLVSVGSLQTDAGGTTIVNGGGVTTTGQQRYRDNVVIGANTVFASTGGGSLLFDGTLSGPFDVNANTTGTTRFLQAVNLRSLTTDAGGVTRIDGGSITTTNAQRYFDKVVLGQNTTLASTAGGEILLNDRVMGLGLDLTINTSGATSIGGVVDLGSFTTDAPGTTRLGGTINTTNGLFINDEILIVGDSALNDSSGNALEFLTAINGDGGAFNLSISSAGDVIFRESIGANSAIGDFIVATTSDDGKLFFHGQLVRTTGDILLNPNGRGFVPTVATIIAPDGGITFETSMGLFRMGQNEKMTVFGDLNVNVLGINCSATLSDINTLGDMNITAPSIFLLTRDPGFLLDRFGFLSVDPDFGLDYLAGGVFRFSVKPVALGGGSAFFANPDGTGDVLGTLRGFVVQAFGEPITTDLLVSLDGVFLDLRSDGPTNANISEALAAALPRESETDEVPQDTSLGSTELDKLRVMGIDARTLGSAELVANTQLGVSLYNDSRRIDVPSLEITVNRLLSDHVRNVLAEFDRMIGAAAEATESPEALDAMEQARSQRVMERLAEARLAYREQYPDSETLDPVQYRSLLVENGYNEAIAYLDDLASLLPEIRLLGLSDREFGEVRNRLIARILPSNMSIADIQAVINARPEVSSASRN